MAISEINLLQWLRPRRNPLGSTLHPPQVFALQFHRISSMEPSKESLRSQSQKQWLLLLLLALKTLLSVSFLKGKPSMELIRKFLSIQNFTGDVVAGLLDKKHVVLRFALPDDYVRLFSKPIWNVYGKSMRILKWSPDFHVDREPSIVPIWIVLPTLPLHLVNEDFIFSLVSSFSKPLKIDTATELLNRPSVARVLVEFDLLEQLPSRVWIQNESGRGFWKSIIVEKPLPPYCKFCWHIGHEEHFCTVKYPDSQKAYSHKHVTHIYKEFSPKQKEDILPDNNAALIQNEGSKTDATLGELDNEKTAAKVDEVQPSAAKCSSSKGSRELQVSKSAPSAAALGQSSLQLQDAIADEGLPRSHFEQGMTATLLNSSAHFDTKVAQTKNAMMNKEAAMLNTTETNMIQFPKSPPQAAAQGKGLYAPVQTQTASGPMVAIEGIQLKGMEHAHEVRKLEEIQAASGKFDKAHTGLATCDQNNLEKSGSKAFTIQMKEKQNNKPAALVNEGVLLDAPTILVNQVIEYSEGCPISNPFEFLSMPSTEKALKPSGIDSRDSIQAELRYMCLDPKVQLGEYISDEVFEEKFTLAKKITRTRKQKKIFDL